MRKTSCLLKQMKIWKILCTQLIITYTAWKITPYTYYTVINLLLLTGWYDIKQVQEDAELKRLALQVLHTVHIYSVTVSLYIAHQ